MAEQPSVRVGAVQYGPVSLDLDGNVERMVKWIEVAAKLGCQVVVFPELSDSGYIRWPASRQEIIDVGRFAACARRIPGPTSEGLATAARRYGVHVVAGVLEADAAVEGRIYNSAVLIDDRGQVLGVHRKITASMAEMFYFDRGNKLEVFRTDLGCIGLGICYDVLFPEHARIQTLSGMELYCCVWNTGYLRGSQPATGVPVGYQRDHLRQATQMRAAENGIYVISAHRVGHDSFADSDFMGLSCVVSPWGTIIAEAEGDDEGVTRATLELDSLAEARAMRPFLKDRRPELYDLLARQ